jgi:hypothetical protein
VPLRYAVYVAAGFFYWYAFVLLAGMASQIGGAPVWAFLGALLLFTFAGLALFWPRISAVHALASVVLIWPWCVGLTVEMAGSETAEPAWLFVVPLVPVLAVTILAIRSFRLRVASPARGAAARAWLAVRALLATLPVGLTVAWFAWLRTRG